MEISSKHLQCHILCVHAPFSICTYTHPEDFWTEVRQVLMKGKNQHWPLLVAGDLNAKVGSVPSDAISTCHAEEESDIGSLVHAFLLELDLCLPATFASCQVTEGPTWKVGLPGQSRIEFVAVPQPWLVAVTDAKIRLDVHLVSEADHQVTSVGVALSCQSRRPRLSSVARPCAKKLKDPACVQSFLADLQTISAAPWTWGVGVHCEYLVTHLQSLVKRHFPTEPKPQWQIFLSSSAWDSVTMRHTLLITCTHLTKVEMRVRALFCLCLWHRLFPGRMLRVYKLLPAWGLSCLLWTFSLGKGTLRWRSPLANFKAPLSFLSLMMWCCVKRCRRQFGRIRKACKADRLAAIRSVAQSFADTASLSTQLRFINCWSHFWGLWPQTCLVC